MSGENVNIPKDMLKMMKELMDMGAVGIGGFVDDSGKMCPITLGQMPMFGGMPNMHRQPVNKKPTESENCSCDCHDEDYRSCDCENCDFDCGGCDCDGCDCEDELDCDETFAPALTKSMALNAYVLENGTYSLCFECGNFAKEDIEISYDKNTITVTAIRSEVHKLPEDASFGVIKKTITEEFKQVEKATRAITLDEPDFAKAKAEFKNGILTINIPKKAKPEPSKINIL